MTFNPGDVVQLKSGGPRMVIVTVLAPDSLLCVWFDANQNKLEAFFSSVVLDKSK